MTTCSGTWSKGTHDPWARHGLCGGGGNHGTRSAATPIRRDDLRSSCPRTPSTQPIMPLGVVRSGTSPSTLCRPRGLRRSSLPRRHRASLYGVPSLQLPAHALGSRGDRAQTLPVARSCPQSAPRRSRQEAPVHPMHSRPTGRGRKPSLRHAILRNRLGASRVRFAADAPLTRPARSRWTGNYRSDGGIGSIPIRLTSFNFARMGPLSSPCSLRALLLSAAIRSIVVDLAEADPLVYTLSVDHGQSLEARIAQAEIDQLVPFDFRPGNGRAI